MNASSNKPRSNGKASIPKTPAKLPTVTDKSRRLEVKETPGKTRDRLLTDVVSQGMASNASTAMRFVNADFGHLSLTDMVASLREQGEAVNRGEFAAAERMLHSQAVALNSIFAEMARRAAANMGEHLGATETYMRLALKSQSQCRSTLEALAAIKNPPVVFARQANINNGGQQQVNNRATADETGTVRAGAHAHAENSQTKPNELLEDLTHGRTQLDSRATQTTGGDDSRLEALGAINGATHG